jgi:hypothetical protein
MRNAHRRVEVENLVRSEGGELVGNSNGCTIFRLRAWLIVRKIGKEEESGLPHKEITKVRVTTVIPPSSSATDSVTV